MTMTPGIQPYYSYTITDKKGKIIRKSRTYKCRSFLRNFMIMLANGITHYPQTIYANGSSYATTETMKYWDTFSNNNARFTYLNIIVGNGVGAVTPTNTWLSSEVTSLTPQALSIGAVQTRPASDEWPDSNYYDMTKVFTNGTGSPVILTEMGLYIYYYYQYYSDYRPFWILLIRDLFPGQVTVANGQSITLKYTIRAII